MGIYSRDYYRNSNASGAWGDWGLYQLTPVVKYLILANIAVFLLIHTMKLDQLNLVFAEAV